MGGASIPAGDAWLACSRPSCKRSGHAGRAGIYLATGRCARQRAGGCQQNSSLPQRDAQRLVTSVGRGETRHGATTPDSKLLLGGDRRAPRCSGDWCNAKSP